MIAGREHGVVLRSVAIALVWGCGWCAFGATESAADHDARMKWWREARFGMFVHWGLYSGLAGAWDGKPVGTNGGMEWIEQRVKADTDTYAKKALPLFKPAQGFADQWAALAKAAGCRYVVFTTKHHDGFALHDSQVSDFDAGSLLHRDLVREIVTALRAQGLRVGFYHSVIDWHHDQYAYALSQQLPHPLFGQPYPNGTRDHAKYVDYLHGEVNELVSNYGPIDILWWDYSSQDFQGQQAWRAFDLMREVRVKQPGVIMNTTWGYSAYDHAWKSDETLIRDLIDIASKGGNFLLNIGPKGDGSIPGESVKALHAIGAWMKVNGESIYGTTASPFEKLPWGRCTRKPGTLYLQVFDWPGDGRLVVQGLENTGVSARLLATGAPLAVTPDTGGLTVVVPANAPDPVCSVIALTVKEPLK